MNQIFVTWLTGYAIVAVFCIICALITPRKNKGLGNKKKGDD